jgi:hypothetical protein
MKESHRMLREAKEHEALDFGIPEARHAPFDGSETAEDGPAMDIAEKNKREEEQYVAFFCPPIDQQLSQPGSSLTGRSIVEEVTEMELSNTLPSYNTPIGRLPRRVRVRRPLTKAQLAKEHNERMERKRAAMLKARRHNDAVLAALIRRTF